MTDIEKPTEAIKPLQSWSELNLPPELQKLIDEAGFTVPTPIQSASIPAAVDGQDLLATSQTGTGKTLSFLIPTILACHGRSGTFALILSPTREIALQTQDALNQFAKPLGINSVALIGGVDLRVDAKALQNYPHVVVATPGRLCDHLERGNIWLDFIEILILDEADRMLDMGFSAQLNKILETVPENAQKLCFSATFSPSIEKIARNFMYKPLRVQMGSASSTTPLVEQKFIYADDRDKLYRLVGLLRDVPGSTMIFVRSKESASNLFASLHSRGIMDATAIHSNLFQKHREQALADFKSGKCRILIATDVAGRGIHVDQVAHVINFELSPEPSDYIHRIGRTGRAGDTGRATTLVGARERRSIRELEELLGKKIVVEGMPAQAPRSDSDRGRPTGGRPGGGGGRPAGKRRR